MSIEIRQRPKFSFKKVTDKDIRKVINYREYDKKTKSVTEVPESYWHQASTDDEAQRVQGIVRDEANKVTEVLVVNFVDYEVAIQDEQPTT